MNDEQVPTFCSTEISGDGDMVSRREHIGLRQTVGGDDLSDQRSEGCQVPAAGEGAAASGVLFLGASLGLEGVVLRLLEFPHGGFHACVEIIENQWHGFVGR